MNYELVETFAVLAKTMNVTKTAEKLFLSQSTVSYRLKALEEELGVILVERDRGFKHIKLTDYGKYFLSIAIEWQNINHKIQNFSSSPFKKTVSIGVVDSVNNYLFSGIYQEIIKNNPNVQLTIKTLHTAEIYDQIDARIIDIGFALNHINQPQIESVKLLDEEMILVTKGKGFANLKEIDPKELNPNNQIFINWGEEYLNWHNKNIPHNSSPKLITDSALLSFEILDEDSWFIAPNSVVNKLSKKFSVHLLLFKEVSPRRTIYMISNKNPLYSNRDAISEFKLLINKYIITQERWQQEFKEGLLKPSS
ncbi:LysR family transcriptional regulator [Neobacillus drentensis]|uniref:LysR family transcriptional regulator n=1 Tax=Neobacillus drentensis TaxID=220684 RepID=UPI001F3B6070|nr:LysR family transcriptional regulator [Neobacillus drentensis]ULT58251.1 LysR family transcriptional regulator [Neobacillus drentensis]